MRTQTIDSYVVTEIASNIPNNRISVRVCKDDLNEVICEGIGSVRVEDRQVGKAVRAFAVLVSLGM